MSSIRTPMLGRLERSEINLIYLKWGSVWIVSSFQKSHVKRNQTWLPHVCCGALCLAPLGLGDGSCITRRKTKTFWVWLASAMFCSRVWLSLSVLTGVRSGRRCDGGSGAAAPGGGSAVACRTGSGRLSGGPTRVLQSTKTGSESALKLWYPFGYVMHSRDHKSFRLRIRWNSYWQY